ncbi:MULTISPECIES: substrate-binding periplasmic protein [Catenuloplanes]|uniref:ABC-type amino acid transport substrate-binding protein n=1 Tax=Catenuloplanes niger TaxID=587534 RepID=A0AAE3ZPA1_9ACTN|nr:transporter substrate-binding domain-containing protein [Catenuloplanes niger]MDR7322577.1 ABC-type amino acid transport substrate-binding protein [Catenuloplanes niger]
MRGLTGVAAAVLLLVTSCGWPRDAAGTLENVRDGVLRAGVTENPPWTVLPDDGEPSGAEPELVRRLADRLGARVEWHPGAESTLMPALKERTLDLVVGGLDATAPWTADASLTRPYLSTDEGDRVWAVPPGENGWQVEVEEFLLTLPDEELARLLEAS